MHAVVVLSFAENQRKCPLSIAVAIMRATVRLTRHARFTVDFDGGYDETDTGPGYDGPPMHSLMVFANPMLAQPLTSDPTVMVIDPSNWENGADPFQLGPQSCSQLASIGLILMTGSLVTIRHGL